MINLIDCGKYEFLKNVSGKKIYAFGAGKQLQNFIMKNKDVIFSGIIDNYKWMDDSKILFGENVYNIISTEQFVQIYDESCVVVITCSMYEEIIEQLDMIPQLNGMDCYLDLLLEQYTEHFEDCPIATRNKKIIPPKIHYCWFGEQELPIEHKKYMESWKKYCPDYEIIRWDESNYDITKNQYMKEAYENKMWAFVSDYARLDIIYRYGGIYLDTDVELVKNLDEFLKWDMFCGFESNYHVAWGLGFGATKKHELVKAVLDVYNHMEFINEDGTLNLTTCPIIQTGIMKKWGFIMNGQPQAIDDIAIYPKEFFAPISIVKGFGRITEHTHSIHHYAASWVNSASRNKLNRWEPLIAKVREHNKTININEKVATIINSKKKCFQIWDCVAETNTAGSKAPNDIKSIAEMLGYQVINIHPLRGEESAWSIKQNSLDWDKCYEMMSENAILLLQHPFWQAQGAREKTIEKLKKEKNIRIISLIHDVEKLRGTFENEYMQHEFEFMLQNADIFIVHNYKMAEFFEGQGIEKERIVTLQLFDYLSDAQSRKRIWEKSIVIAGNLDSRKCSYIEKLNQLKNINIHLYGPNYRSGMETEKIKYHGIIPMNKIISELQGGFGLVWDGDSIDTCSGMSGNYLRYNNPHKLSMYLAAGIPVVVWNEAAVAGFVKEYGVGIVVESLNEISIVLQKVTNEQYEEYIDAVQAIAQKLRQGEFTKAALELAEGLVWEKKADENRGINS